MDILQDYAETLEGIAYSPREYVEKQLNMSEEEKAMRRDFFARLFKEADDKKAVMN